MTEGGNLISRSSPAAVDPEVVAEQPTSLSGLAAAAGADRNRAVDFYRAVAMTMVALGHWAAIAVTVGPDGQLDAGNALSDAPALAWMTWLFQVMPLFFVVGGFSSAMSLDSHARNNGRPQDWVAARLRRMLAPTAVLAATWLALLTFGGITGLGSLLLIGAVAAAIPLWFLANYTIDTAIAPYLLPVFRRRPGLVATAGLTLFVALELVRFAGVPHLPHLNWVLGWLLFQTAGFAWRDGLLPTGLKLVGTAAGLWAVALALVTVGPYPVSMVHFPGIGDLSPTHPPSLALLTFGAAYSATALVAAPAISRWLAAPARAKVWAGVVAANSVAMSVYLWHFTAAVGAGALLLGVGSLTGVELLPTAAVGSTAWWVQKMPLMALALVFLAGIVAVVARFEQRALLAERTPWTGGPWSMVAVAAVVSTAVKLWTAGTPSTVIGGAAIVLAVRHLILGSGLPALSGPVGVGR